MPFAKKLTSLIHNSQVAAHVTEEMRPTPKYILLLVISTFLAHLGIMAGQSTVTIGSMLISPLIWPIAGISLGIVRNNPKMAISGLTNFLASVAFGLTVSYLLTLLFDPQSIGLNSEITSRITPTLLDLGIALITGIAGAMIISWEKISDAAAGVAVASSVLLPMTVTGVGLALGNYDIAAGSFLLFLTSVCSVIFTGIIVFLLLGHHKHNGVKHEGLLTVGLATSAIGLLLLAIPLTITLSQILTENGVSRTAEAELQTSFSAIDESIFIDSVTAKSIETNSGSTMKITALIRGNASLRIPYEHITELTKELETTLDQPVQLDLRILPPLATITNDLAAREARTRQQERIGALLSGALKEIDPRIAIDTIQISNSSPVIITLLVRAPTFVQLSNTNRISLIEKLQNEMKAEVQLDLSVLRTDTISDVSRSEQDSILSNLEKAVDQYASILASTGEVQVAERNATHKDGIYTLRVTLRIPTFVIDTTPLTTILQNTLRSTFASLEENLRIELTLDRYSEI